MHAEVKRICGLELGVVSQCIVVENMYLEKWKSICGKLALKINGKLGGKNCTLAEKLKLGPKEDDLVRKIDIYYHDYDDYCYFLNIIK